MRGHARLPLAAVLFTSFLFGSTPAESSLPTWFSVSHASLCVTEGEINETNGNRLSVNVPKMRAYVNRWTGEAIEARFTYLGPTARQTALGSGQVRRQFGLKLRAQDACNLVYAMWRIEPESEFVVSVKSNPGERTSAECGNRGYRNIKAQKVAPPPPLHGGATHTLRAEMNAAQLAVFVDDGLVWKGSVGTEALSFHGPAGIRSDNVRLELELHAKESGGVDPKYLLKCRSDAEE